MSEERRACIESAQQSSKGILLKRAERERERERVNST
jgi:hypothetical protein